MNTLHHIATPRKKTFLSSRISFMSSQQSWASEMEWKYPRATEHHNKRTQYTAMTFIAKLLYKLRSASCALSFFAEITDFVCLLFESHPKLALYIMLSFSTPRQAEWQKKVYFQCGECVTTSKVDFEGLKNGKRRTTNESETKATARKTFFFLYASLPSSTIFLSSHTSLPPALFANQISIQNHSFAAGQIFSHVKRNQRAHSVCFPDSLFLGININRREENRWYRNVVEFMNFELRCLLESFAIDSNCYR